MEIKDSGKRREFDTGAVRDIQEGKGRCDLLPLDIVSRLLKSDVFLYIDDYIHTGEYSYLIDTLYNPVKNNIYDDIYTMILELSKQFEQGAKKYGEYNWQKGIPTNCYIDSAVRHYLKYLRGDKDEPHDRAFVWNIVCCIWTCINKPELNVYDKENKNDKD